MYKCILLSRAALETSRSRDMVSDIVSGRDVPVSSCSINDGATVVVEETTPHKGKAH